MFEFFDHTADVGIRVQASDLNGVFAEGGRALFALLVENVDQINPRDPINIQLHGRNVEELLFDWLGELLYQFDARHMLFSRFEVEVKEDSLHGRAFGEPLDARRHVLAHEAKAITYHELKVRPTPEGWMAEIIVDI